MKAFFRLLIIIILFDCFFAINLFAENTGENNFLDDSIIDNPFDLPDEDSTKSGYAADVIDDPFEMGDESEDDNSESEMETFDIEEDFDSMFETDSMVDEIDEEEASMDQASAEGFLVSEGVEFGGKFSGSLLSSFNYDYAWTNDFDFFKPDDSLVPSIEADLFFDARPRSDFRVFGKLGFTTASGTSSDLASIIPEDGITFTTETDEDGNVSVTTVDEEDVDENDENQTTIESDDLETQDVETAINLNVKELFVDFDWDSKLYFRFGKSMIKWGVGYFWSPADVLNVAEIDVEDPTAEREGPISFKMHLPFDIDNAYLYLITENVSKPLDVALAPKLEFVLGGTEIGIGGYFQIDSAPKLMTTISSSIGDFAVFGEGVASWGSDRLFVRASKDQSAAEEDEEDELETVLDTYWITDKPFFSATVGANYTKELENDFGMLMAVGQYFFNGEGYADSSLLPAAVRLFLNPTENGLALDAADQPEGYEAPADLTTSDVTNFGMHYLGLFFSWSKMFNTDLSFSTLYISNFSDLSGMVMPNLSYAIMDYISISAGATLTYGDVGDEYTNTAALFGLNNDWDGPTVSFTLECSIGGGSF